MAFLYKMPTKLNKNLNILNINTKNKLYSEKKNYQELIKPLNGLELGIPLNIFSNIYTYLYFGEDITNIESIILQFLIGYYVYGRDRYKDAIEYDNLKNQTNIITKKEDLYNIINHNLTQYEIAHSISFTLIMSILLDNNYWLNNIPFILLLLSTEFYKDFKKNFGNLKPLYVSFMWTMCTIIFPAVSTEHNFDILSHPVNYLPIFLSIFATSNFADIKDIDEDKTNNIETLVIKLGEENSVKIILISLIISSFLLGINENFIDRPLVNSILELQNAGSSLALLPLIFNITKY